MREMASQDCSCRKSNSTPSKFFPTTSSNSVPRLASHEDKHDIDACLSASSWKTNPEQPDSLCLSVFIPVAVVGEQGLLTLAPTKFETPGFSANPILDPTPRSISLTVFIRAWRCLSLKERLWEKNSKTRLLALERDSEDRHLRPWNIWTSKLCLN